MIGLVTVSAAGRVAAERLRAAGPGPAGDLADYPVADLSRAFSECDVLVCFLATGATVRLLAPLLTDKRTDPGVVVVDEAGRFAVSLVGGHDGRANEHTRWVADILGAQPVVTTASDAVGLPGLDTLGWPVEGAVAAVGRAMLDGSPVRLISDATWPLPPLPVETTPQPVEAMSVAAQPAAAEAGSPPVGAASLPVVPGSPVHGGHVLRVTDLIEPAHDRMAVLRPPSLVLGIGASRGVTAEEVLGLVDRTLADAGLSAASVAEVATAEVKRDEAGLLQACAQRGWALRFWPVAQLTGVDVPNPSEVVAHAVGTRSVAEAAALLTAGLATRAEREPGAGPAVGELVVSKTASPMATVAVARRHPRGRLALVGLGPGARDLLTPRARDELRRASVWVGLDQYVDQVRDLARPGTRMLVTGLGAEQERAESAVREAQQGHAVALLGSGDAGVYAMASPALMAAGGDIRDRDLRDGDIAGGDIDVVGVPGVTAALAASNLLGAPLGHDHASISLSDLHTPWPAIETRVRAVAQADLVVTFYNPRSRGRDWQLPRALALLAEHRPVSTPVGVVTEASRPAETVQLTTLGELDPTTVTMLACVTVGSSQSTVVGGRFVTPRGYTWADDDADTHPGPGDAP